MQLLPPVSSLHQRLVKLVIYSLGCLITARVIPCSRKITVKARLTTNAEVGVELAGSCTHHVEFMHATKLLLLMESPGGRLVYTRPMLLKKLLPELGKIGLTFICCITSLISNFLVYLSIIHCISTHGRPFKGVLLVIVGCMTHLALFIMLHQDL